jgi:hypothetical protein
LKALTTYFTLVQRSTHFTKLTYVYIIGVYALSLAAGVLDGYALLRDLLEFMLSKKATLFSLALLQQTRRINANPVRFFEIDSSDAYHSVFSAAASIYDPQGYV